MDDKFDDWEKLGFIKASEHRKKILLSLRDNPKTPKELVKETGFYISHISYDLRELSESGFIECKTPNLKKGKLFSLTELGKKIVEKL